MKDVKSKKSLLSSGERKNADALKEVASALGLEAQELTRQRWIIRVGSMLSSLRRRAGLTQEQMAARSGLTQAYLSRLENGLLPVRGPTLDVLVRCASAVGCELELSLKSKATGEYLAIARSPDQTEESNLEPAIGRHYPDLLAATAARAARVIQKYDVQATTILPYGEIDMFFGAPGLSEWPLAGLYMDEESEDAARLTSAYEELGRARAEVNALREIKQEATQVDISLFKVGQILPLVSLTTPRESSEEDDRERIYSIGKRILETLRSIWPMYRRLSKDDASSKREHVGREKIELAREDLVVVGYDHEMHFSDGSSSSDPHKINLEDFETYGRHKRDS